MNNGNDGARLARRWGRILCGMALASGLAGCATDKVGRPPEPPEHCNRKHARPANPFGSIFAPNGGTQPAAEVPTQGEQGVMVFPAPSADPALPESALPGAGLQQSAAPTVPAVTPRAGRPLSMGSPTANETSLGSC